MFAKCASNALVTQPADNFVDITCHVKPFFHLRSPGSGGREGGGREGRVYIRIDKWHSFLSI